MITHTTAKDLDLNAILITSGNESIMSAFDQVVKISTSYIQLKQDNKFLKEIIKKDDNYTIVFSPEGDVCLSTWDLENAEEIYQVLKSEIPQVISSECHKIFRNINDTLYSIISRLVNYQSKNYIVFYVTASKIPITTIKNGIKFSNKKKPKNNSSIAFIT